MAIIQSGDMEPKVQFRYNGVDVMMDDFGLTADSG